MKDLLKEFVELAPKEWGAEFCESKTDGLQWVKLSAISGSTYREQSDIRFRIDDDRASSEAIIFLWDYLNPADFGYCGNRPESIWSVVTNAESSTDPCPVSFGSTRIEALVRACVAYWRSKK